MARVRISTTVDAETLAHARRLGGAIDADVLDRALRLFVETIEAEREREAIRRQPYHLDPELELPEPGPGAFAALPYDGDVPPAVLALAAARRRERGT